MEYASYTASLFGPLPAGNYGVYEIISYHCDSGMACTGIVMSRRMGSITVTNPASVLRKPASVPVFGNLAGNPGRIFTLRGELIGRSAYQNHIAGMAVTVSKNRSFAVVNSNCNR